MWHLIHYIVCLKLISAKPGVSLLTGCEWMSEKLNMLSNVKLKSGPVLWPCHCGTGRFSVDSDAGGEELVCSLRSCIQAHVDRWSAVIHWLWTPVHVVLGGGLNQCRLHLAGSGRLDFTIKAKFLNVSSMINKLNGRCACYSFIMKVVPYITVY